MVISDWMIWAMCIATGLLFWLILYFKDTTFKDAKPWWTWIMMALRGLTTACLLYLILAPFIKSIFTEIKRPTVVIAQDNSLSLNHNWAQSKKDQYLRDKSNLESLISKNYEVISLTFGEHVKENGQIDFSERATDISSALDYIQNQLAGQNLGAIVLATDGNFNQGRNPLYSNPGLTAPIYTIALGDTTIKRDLSIQRVMNNSIVYLGDQLEIQAEISARQCQGESANVQLLRIEENKETLLKTEKLSISENDWHLTQKFIVSADKAGTAHYMIRISPIANEFSKENNVKDLFIEVLDARQKILILAASPHPDLAAIKKILERNKNYDVHTKLSTDPAPNWNDYSVVLFHQLPSRTYPLTNVIKELNKTQKPRLFIVGSGTDLPGFNASQTLLRINGDGKNTNDVSGVIKESFSLFTPSPEWKDFFRNFPPLASPFGDFAASPGAQALFVQKIGNVTTNYPLFLVGEDQGTRSAILAGEGIWKWRLFNYLQSKNFDMVDDLMLKTIQYIGLKDDKRKFKVYTQQKIFLENQPILFDAQLFNDSYEPVNNEDVSMTITSGDKKEYKFTFNKTDRAYALDAGLFAPGNYVYNASVDTKTGKQTVSGQFIVQKIQLETYQSTADHNLLRLLSSQQGGVNVSPDNILSLSDLIVQNKTVKPIQYSSQRTYPIINFKWIFACMALFLSLEWFLRRYLGAY